MTDDEFWKLIALLDWSQAGDDEAVVDPVVSALAAGPVSAIEGFEDVLAAKLHQLDTVRHAREIGEDAYESADYFSPDMFLYARCCVVANGREVFERVLASPAEFPKDLEFEALLSVAETAYERKTGASFEYSSAVDYETYANKAGWTEA